MACNLFFVVQGFEDVHGIGDEFVEEYVLKPLFYFLGLFKPFQSKQGAWFQHPQSKQTFCFKTPG